MAVISENSTVCFLMAILAPLLGLLVNALFFRSNPSLGSKIATVGVWIGLINTMIAWILGLPLADKKEFMFFIANEISWIMATLILFISGIVHHFSLRYLAGDRNYHHYFLRLTAITISMLCMVASDNVILLMVFWLFSNLMLTLLMMHKFQWLAAKNSAMLALKTFVLGLLFLMFGVGLLVYESKTLSLHLMTEHSNDLSASLRMLALFFIMLAAFTQSGAWPFHRWLISSLNSPTPVSSLMHAGLVNGGGLLLSRFALIFLHESLILNSLFLFGVITLVLGGIWKLIQSDIKRMLACSTMTQMGFMIMQCGLGIFPAALAHLCWHGLFKSFLFLRAGSSIVEKRGTNEQRTSTLFTFFLAALCGILGAYGFMLGAHFLFGFKDTTTVLVLFAWMTATQLAHTLLEKKRSLFFISLASLLCLIAGFVYGTTMHVVEKIVAAIGIFQPQPLSSLHVAGVALIVCIWLAMNLKIFMRYERSFLWRYFYVRMLNASQPHQNTITPIRSGYKF